MSAPVIHDFALTTVDIDPYVEYTYVLPVQGQTSAGFTPNENFDMSMTGLVLTLKFIGVLPPATLSIDPEADSAAFLAVTEFPIVLFASNSDGTTELTVTFRIPRATYSIPLPPGGAGGTVATSGSQSYLVGDTSEMSEDIPIRLIYRWASQEEVSDVIPPPAFVKEIIDSTHVKISSTIGGSAITAGATVAVSGAQSLEVLTYPRKFVAITGPTFLSSKPKTTVDESLTATPDPDLWQIKGLPVELRLPAGTSDVGGVAPASGYYPITLIARLGENDSKRTMVLEIDET